MASRKIQELLCPQCQVTTEVVHLADLRDATCWKCHEPLPLPAQPPSFRSTLKWTDLRFAAIPIAGLIAKLQYPDLVTPYFLFVVLMLLVFLGLWLYMLNQYPGEAA